MPDPLQKYSPGQDWEPQAEWLNQVTDSLKKKLAADVNQSPDRSIVSPRNDSLYVANFAGQVLDQFNVVGLGDLAITPTLNIQEWRNRLLWKSAAPLPGARFGILQAPIPNDSASIAKIFVTGVSRCKVSMGHATDPYAGPISGNYTTLLSNSTSGPASILWHEEPAAWSNSTPYVIGDMVSLAGRYYTCNADHTGHTPPNATYWTPGAVGWAVVMLCQCVVGCTVCSTDCVQLSFPGVAQKSDDCPDCSLFAGVLALTPVTPPAPWDIAYRVDVQACSDDPVPLRLQVWLMGKCNFRDNQEVWNVFVTETPGTNPLEYFVRYELALPTSSWDCVTPMELALVEGGVNNYCTDFPPTVTVSACGGSGSGGVGSPTVTRNTGTLCKPVTSGSQLTIAGTNFTATGNTATLTDSLGASIANHVVSVTGTTSMLVEFDATPADGAITAIVVNANGSSAPAVQVGTVDDCSALWHDTFTGVGDLNSHIPDASPGGVGYASSAGPLIIVANALNTVTAGNAYGNSFNPGAAVATGSIDFTLSSGWVPGAFISLQPRFGGVGVSAGIGTTGSTPTLFVTDQTNNVSGFLSLSTGVTYTLTVQNLTDRIIATCNGVTITLMTTVDAGLTSWEITAVGATNGQITLDNLNVVG